LLVVYRQHDIFSRGREPLHLSNLLQVIVDQEEL